MKRNKLELTRYIELASEGIRLQAGLVLAGVEPFDDLITRINHFNQVIMGWFENNQFEQLKNIVEREKHEK